MTLDELKAFYDELPEKTIYSKARNKPMLKALGFENSREFKKLTEEDALKLCIKEEIREACQGVTVKVSK